jgi:hypothetical protein
MKYVTLPLIILAFLFAFCKKKDEVNEPVSNNQSVEVRAGIYDGSYTYTELVTPITITMSWDAQNLYGTGIDSLDLDSDGDFDLTLELDLLNEDSLHLISGYPIPFPSLELKAKNGLEIGTYVESFYIGLGQTATINYAERLDFDARVDLVSQWHTTIDMWAENPNDGMTPSFGDWYDADGIFYLAIKFNGKYGWIAIDATNPEDPAVLNWAYLN